ncbi:MAG: PAS-domain containing protein, partial [Rhodospirillales bacterium]
MKPRLRYLLAAAFTIVAIVPVLFLGVWVQRTAVEREFAAVSEKHLLIARNVTAALDRHARDVEAVFGFFADSADDLEPTAATLALARRNGFRHFCVVDGEGRVLVRLNVSEPIGERFPADTLKRLTPLTAGDGTAFSGVMADSKGRPTIYLVRRLGPDRIAIGALALDYIRSLQRAVAFGRKGHSAIVDRQGNVIAHPNADWQRQMKNIAAVEPVRRMMAGETGVASFYSPAVKKDMITGFTTVPRTGWGVMVPQPLEELEERASEVNQVALVLIVAGLLTAALISWVLSGLLVRPVEAVVRAARDIADGNLEARVPRRFKVAPVEFSELGIAFNAMARDVATVMIQRERVEDELRQARDELEARVEERTRALTEEIAGHKRTEESLLRLAAAVEGLSELFVLYDADDKMVHCNERYREINEAVADATVPGTPFEDHQRALIDKGLFDGIEGREDEWLQERIARHRNPSGPFEVQRNGRWMLVNEQRLPDGSTATIATDITDRREAEEALRLSEERLRGAVESLQEGFALFDADDRLVALNEEYRRVSPAAQEIMERGGTFEDAIRANVARGVIVEAQGREDMFLAERMAQHRDPKGPLIRRFTDGSWYMLSEARTPEGGIALSFIDIT